MEQPDKQLMSELESIINNAAKGHRENKRKEMLQALRTISQSAEKDFSFTEEPYALILIQQVGLDEVDEHTAHRPPEAQGMSLKQLDAEGYGAGAVTRPFTTATMEELTDIMDSPANQLMTDVSLGKKDWASVTRHKQNGATVYMMVAGGCVTTLTLTPSGEEVTSHSDMRDEDIPALINSVCGDSQAMLKSQWNFTSSIQMLRNQYPNSYAELAKEMEQRFREMGDEQ